VIALVRAEWLKLRTTAVPWVLGGIALVLDALLVLTVFLTRPSFNGSPRGPGPRPGFIVPHTVTQLRDLVGAGFETYLLAMLLGALCITTEFRHKTVTTSFLVVPRRAVFVAAKLITAVLVGAALAVVVLAATVGGGGAALAARGGSFVALLHQVPAVAPGMILVFALFAVLGVGVGSLLTNQVAAITALLGWFVVAQSILVGLVHSALRWVPTGAAEAAANISQRQNGSVAGFGLFAWWQGALLILAYGIAFAVAGWAVMTRRDIT
jgi:ABC-type transport system involved in multi-copper enzyme maturation permease subunit